MTVLYTKEDMEWLANVHFKAARAYKLAILHGNEDSPAKVELFRRNHYKCKPTVVEPKNGKLVIITLGD